MKLNILYEDDSVVVIHKPAGLLVHRTALDRKETQFAMQILRDQIGHYVYPVHRLDRPTSGVLLFAKSSSCAAKLQLQFQSHQVGKEYIAVVRGYMNQSMTLDYPLKEELDPIADKLASRTKDAQPALTEITAGQGVELPHSVGRYSTCRYSWVKLQPMTGRKHQLRRHMAHLRHPIVGDTTHGDGKHNAFFRQQMDCARLLLEATSINFQHPVTSQPIRVSTSYDETFVKLAEAFSWRFPNL
jgi:tRNA pseudouridine65 synthase